MVLLVLILSLFMMDTMGAFFTAANSFVSEYFGWFYTLVMNISLVTVLLLLAPRFKHIKLGKPLEKPEFSFPAWMAMLFTAGIGIGLLYYGMAEPMLHNLKSPSGATPYSKEAYEQAFHMVFLHYGAHPWAVYSLVGLAVLYYTHKYDLSLRISSLLHPLLGERVNQWPGTLVDITAILAVLAGVSTTLGIGVQQINGGLHYLWDVDIDRSVQVALIIGITLLATFSVVSGLDKGILGLSLATAGTSVVLLFFVIWQNPFSDQVSHFWEVSRGFFVDYIPYALSLKTRDNPSWQQNWTTFYWAWWIAWAPFVGMFIARISGGRSLRQYIMGTLMIPSGFCCFWIASFGYAAFAAAGKGSNGLENTVVNEFSVSFFEFLSLLPFSEFTSALTVVLLIGFFVTSSDSGSLVVDIIAAKGNPHPPVWQRIFWSFMEGALAATLLLVGGLSALQAGSLLSALPFGVVVVVVAFTLVGNMIKDSARVETEVCEASEAERS